MKINIVSDTTYYPSRVRNDNRSAEITGKSNNKVNGKSDFEKLLLEKLSSEEAVTIQKLFGEFQIDKVNDNLNGSESIAGKLSAIPRGRFVDIKI